MVRVATGALLLSLSALASCVGAAENVPGEWSFVESGGGGRAKIGLSLPDDLLFFFLYMQCNEDRRQATGHFEIPPEKFGNFIGDNRYLRLRFRNGDTELDVPVEAIVMIEIGHGWAPQFRADRALLEHWSRPGRLEVQLGELTKTGFVSGASYVLPELNRTAATNAFIAACFPR